jgi:hypothetical protein
VPSSFILPSAECRLHRQECSAMMLEGWMDHPAATSQEREKNITQDASFLRSFSFL